MTPGCVRDEEECNNDDDGDEDCGDDKNLETLNRKISPSYIEIGVDKTLKRKKTVNRRRSSDKTNRALKTEIGPRRRANLEKIDEVNGQANLKTAPERDNISVSTFIIEPAKTTSSIFSSKTCSIM